MADSKLGQTIAKLTKYPIDPAVATLAGAVKKAWQAQSDKAKKPAAKAILRWLLQGEEPTCLPCKDGGVDPMREDTRGGGVKGGGAAAGGGGEEEDEDEFEDVQ